MSPLFITRMNNNGRPEIYFFVVVDEKTERLSKDVKIKRRKRDKGDYLFQLSAKDELPGKLQRMERVRE